MDAAQYPAETRRRVRRHMFTSFGGFLLAIALMVASGALSVALFGSPPPSWVAILPGLGIAMIPAIGFYSTYKNLRCPACDRSIAFQVSTKYSLFSSVASNQCRHCGATIFDDETARRVRRTLLVAVCLGVGLGFVSSLVAVLSQH